MFEGDVVCALCGENCEYVHWKIHIPSPKNAKEWKAFWNTYLHEKRLIEEFQQNPRMEEVNLPLLNMRLTRPQTSRKKK